MSPEQLDRMIEAFARLAIAAANLREYLPADTEALATAREWAAQAAACANLGRLAVERARRGDARSR